MRKLFAAVVAVAMASGAMHHVLAKEGDVVLTRTSDQAKVVEYVNAAQTTCANSLPIAPGMAKVSPSDATAFCKCIYDTASVGLTAADVDAMKEPGVNGKYASERGLAVHRELNARFNAAMPGCRASKLAKYTTTPQK